jgi:soluble cytochrome b562
MRYLLALFALVPLHALSLQDFNAKPPADQSRYVADYIDKMASDLGVKNPALGAAIRDYFGRRAEGKPFSEGMEKLYMQLTTTELQAKDGRVDLSKIQLESVIVWVVRQKFPPPAKQ